MGSCVSLHHKEHQSAMKLSLSVSDKNDTLLIPSPVKPPSDSVNVAVDDVAFKSNNISRGFPGSKEEAFFDSQPWMDSDCEDDFYSVNGDFTPSRGNTPVHHNFSAANLRVIKPSVTEETTTEAAPLPSPPEKKKRLSELFQESLRHEEYPAENGTAHPAKDEANSNEKTPNGASSKESKSFMSAQCCIPGLRSSRSFNEERKKKTATSPARSVG